MVELHWTEVDGVTTLWTESSEPFRAELLFRTGLADETLITAGQTHLIEHMVLSEVNDRLSNGFVNNLVTGFVRAGRPEDVSDFLARVCDALQSFPADRLDAEKKILSTEASTRSRDICSDLLMWRFGANGHGLRGLPEFGIHGATLERLHNWRAQRFTRENAILWLSGPLPPGLHLNLPPGEKQPLPPLASMQSQYPCWYVVNDQAGGVAVSSIVPRVSASTIFGMIASNRLRDCLRTEKAVSYSPTTFYEPLTADKAHLVLFADSELNRRAELNEAFGEVFGKLAEYDEAEVDAARKEYLDYMTGHLAPSTSERMVYEAQHAAIDWLYGREYESMDSIIAETAKVSAADLAEFGRAVQSTSIFAVPGRVRIQPWMGEKALEASSEVIKGREVLRVDAPVEPERLVYCPEGVSLRHPDGSNLTISYSRLAGVLHYEDGCICLIHSDATCIQIEPTLWRNGPSICREIFEKVPVHLRIEQEPRSEDQIPKPKTTAWQRFRATLSQRL